MTAQSGPGPAELGLARRAVAEGVGTGLLVVAVVGSGIMATRLSPGDRGLQLLENALSTAGALVALIVALGAVSGAHFNPAVTLVSHSLGSIGRRDAGGYVAAQLVGGSLGTVVANVMFDLPAVHLATETRSSAALWLAEVVATTGLLLVIQGCIRSGRTSAVALAVGSWVGAAYWFTSSTGFANPAVTVARTLTDSFTGIAPASAPMFVVMQLVGAGVAVALIRVLFPLGDDRVGEAR